MSMSVACQLILVTLATCTVVSSQSGLDVEQQTNCSNSFFLLEQSLLQSTDNRFHLLKVFYPPRQARPVLVNVTYTFDGLDNSTQTWYWSESEFYLIQPLEIFQFTSLLLSDMPYRSGEVSILLAGDCSSAPEDYMQMLTTRVSI